MTDYLVLLMESDVVCIVISPKSQDETMSMRRSAVSGRCVHAPERPGLGGGVVGYSFDFERVAIFGIGTCDGHARNSSVDLNLGCCQHTSGYVGRSVLCDRS